MISQISVLEISTSAFLYLPVSNAWKTAENAYPQIFVNNVSSITLWLMPHAGHVLKMNSLTFHQKSVMVVPHHFAVKVNSSVYLC
jgi:hypothetical protein